MLQINFSTEYIGSLDEMTLTLHKFTCSVVIIFAPAPLIREPGFLNDLVFVCPDRGEFCAEGAKFTEQYLHPK